MPVKRGKNKPHWHMSDASRKIDYISHIVRLTGLESCYRRRGNCAGSLARARLQRGRLLCSAIYPCPKS